MFCNMTVLRSLALLAAFWIVAAASSSEPRRAFLVATRSSRNDGGSLLLDSMKASPFRDEDFFILDEPAKKARHSTKNAAMELVAASLKSLFSQSYVLYGTGAAMGVLLGSVIRRIWGREDEEEDDLLPATPIVDEVEDDTTASKDQVPPLPPPVVEMIPKEQYEVLEEEIALLQSQLQSNAEKMEKLEKNGQHYEMLHEQHETALTSARTQAKEQLSQMQRAMVSVMKQERDDLIIEFQRQAAAQRDELLQAIAA